MITIKDYLNINEANNSTFGEKTLKFFKQNVKNHYQYIDDNITMNLRQSYYDAKNFEYIKPALTKMLDDIYDCLNSEKEYSIEIIIPKYCEQMWVRVCDGQHYDESLDSYTIALFVITRTKQDTWKYVSDDSGTEDVKTGLKVIKEYK